MRKGKEGAEKEVLEAARNAKKALGRRNLARAQHQVLSLPLSLPLFRGGARALSLPLSRGVPLSLPLSRGITWVGDWGWREGPTQLMRGAAVERFEKQQLEHDNSIKARFWP